MRFECRRLGFIGLFCLFLLSFALQIVMLLFLLTLSSCYTTSILVGTSVRYLSLSRLDLFLWRISLFRSEKVKFVRLEAWPCPSLDAPGWLGGWLIKVGGPLCSDFLQMSSSGHFCVQRGSFFCTLVSTSIILVH